VGGELKSRGRDGEGGGKFRIAEGKGDSSDNHNLGERERGAWREILLEQRKKLSKRDEEGSTERWGKFSTRGIP